MSDTIDMRELQRRSEEAKKGIPWKQPPGPPLKKTREQAIPNVPGEPLAMVKPKNSIPEGSVVHVATPYGLFDVITGSTCTNPIYAVTHAGECVTKAAQVVQKTTATVVAALPKVTLPTATLPTLTLPTLLKATTPPSIKRTPAAAPLPAQVQTQKPLIDIVGLATSQTCTNPLYAVTHAPECITKAAGVVAKTAVVAVDAGKFATAITADTFKKIGSLSDPVTQGVMAGAAGAGQLLFGRNIKFNRDAIRTELMSNSKFAAMKPAGQDYVLGILMNRLTSKKKVV